MKLDMKVKSNKKSYQGWILEVQNTKFLTRINPKPQLKKVYKVRM